MACGVAARRWLPILMQLLSLSISAGSPMRSLRVEVDRRHSDEFGALSSTLLALGDFKRSITSDPTHALDTWDTANMSGDPCSSSWIGVSCDSRGRVTSISLSNRSLQIDQAGFPHTLSLLTSLTSLDLSFNDISFSLSAASIFPSSSLSSLNLSHNSISGSPALSCFSNLTSLSSLALDNNHLDGPLTIPPSCFPHLLTLNLAANTLSSSLPSSLSSCSALRHLDLSFNNFTGTLLPISFPNITHLTYFDISYNNYISGSIPASLGNCTGLQHLDFAGVPLEGAIPPSLGLGCRNLTYLSLFYCSLNGSVPPEMALLSNLETLVLEGNSFSGLIFGILMNFTELKILDLFGNFFHGTIPEDFGVKLTKLNKLILGLNKFTGPIPSSIGNCTELTHLILGFSNFSGNIPATISKCSKITHMDLQFSNFAGEIPSGIGNLTLMVKLLLNNNQLSGSIPQALGELASLQGISLENNHLSGQFPKQMFNCSNLQAFRISNNLLQGSIPSSIGMLWRLEDLQAQQNQLTGTIPDGLSNCTKLKILNFGSNNFVGSIPMCLFSSSMGDFININISNNKLSGAIPNGLGNLAQLVTLDLSNNNLSGIVPSDIFQCRALTTINLSMNSLIGPISYSIGMSLQSLVKLNFSHNSINGSIPSNLGNLTLLQQLDLSSNGLEGEIPISLANIKTLAFLNLSFNNLQGPIPKDGGIFNNATVASFLGNPQLCGSILSKICLKRIQQNPRTSRLYSNEAKIAFIVSGAIFGVILILGCALILLYELKPVFLGDPRSETSDLSTLDPKLNPLRLRWDEIKQATNHFSPENIIGRGSSAEVYKGVMPDGQVLAFKKFTVESRSIKCFFREIKSLGRIQHQNLIKILGYWSNHMDTNILILEHMMNGNLEDFLHPKTDYNNLKLPWDRRWKVAREIAQGLCYLHHGRHSPIVHCDIKPSNILFNVDMEARISDFGLAKVVVDMVTSTQNLKGTRGYIAPECASYGQISTKCDVYSYGVVLMELVTGRRPTDIECDEMEDNKTAAYSLIKLVASMVESHDIYDIVDHALKSEFDSNIESICSIIIIALKCTQENPRDRPTIEEIIGKLNAMPPKNVEDTQVFL